MTVDQVISGLLHAAPHLGRRWALVAADAPDARPAMKFGWFAAYIAEDIECGRYAHMADVGAVIEAGINSPDQGCADAVAAGFVEGLTNRAIGRGLELDRNWFGPRTRAFMIAIDDFWGTHTPGVG